MGSAIECFDDAGAVVVPRSRFAPVKTCNDLFALRSGARPAALCRPHGCRCTTVVALRVPSSACPCCLPLPAPSLPLLPPYLPQMPTR